MKTIELTKGYKTLVDNEDYDNLNCFSWYYAHGYAVRTIYNEGKPYQLRMHRILVNTPLGLDTDHINGNPLDNRKSNLRFATRSQNASNASTYKSNNSGYKGVSWKKSNHKWCAQISVMGRVVHIGLYLNIKDAARAYNKAAQEHHGKFAVLNQL